MVKSREHICGEDCRRLVVKLGTNLLTAGGERLSLDTMASLVGQVNQLQKQGRQVLVVTSGAVAAGRQELGLAPSTGSGQAPDRKDIPFKQVLAAVGQGRLMEAYHQLFAWHGVVIAQTLLTRRDLSDRLGYLNARNTLLALLELNVVPIINENDVVAVEELEGTTFGDNDNLSAMVANLVDADLLVILSDIQGLFTADPRLNAQATLVTHVDSIDAEIEKAAGGSGSARGVGGMATKIQAAKLATASGAAVIIADGRQPEVLLRVLGNEAIGTYFAPAASKLESRQRWLVSGPPPRGKLRVDSGAATALKGQGKSLLAVGIQAVEGDFQRGDVVHVCDGGGKTIACGLVNYPSEDIARIRGQRSERIHELLGYAYGDEVVHRDNLVLV
ncbi:MAG: glutamate 5-kinase [Chloroflexi bacterium]|nr:glutamate 5-kinase [Chloroflexota bacterium]